MDHILFLNSASIDTLSISSSLIAEVGSNIDFSLASQVSGAFVGSLIGTASYALQTDTAISSAYASEAGHATTATSADTATTSTSASHALYADVAGIATTATSTISASHALYADTAGTANTAISAQTASYVSGIKIKSGKVNGSSFAGNPQIYNVIFSTNFPDTNYSITIVGTTARTWVVDNQTVSGFTINSNTKTSVSGFVFWTATSTGEYNI